MDQKKHWRQLGARPVVMRGDGEDDGEEADTKVTDGQCGGSLVGVT